MLPLHRRCCLRRATAAGCTGVWLTVAWVTQKRMASGGKAEAKAGAIRWCDAPQRCTNSIHAAPEMRAADRESADSGREENPAFKRKFTGPSPRLACRSALFSGASPGSLKHRPRRPTASHQLRGCRHGISIALQRTGANGGLNVLHS